jgi:glucose/arabinose dehydrogenase
MFWRRTRLPLALVLLGLFGWLLLERIDEVEAMLVELGGSAAPLPARRARASETVPAAPAVRLVEVARGFDRPLLVTHAGDGSGRLFVVEQTGKIRIARAGTLEPVPFLDLAAALDTAAGERGLLGLAFAPDYPRSGLFYVAHTAPGPQGVVRRFRVASDPDRADPASGELVLALEDPAGNHNGGMLAFGPDGYLWIGTGDGGSAGDPWDNAQNPKSLLGKMLRIDVRTKPYAIPPDNPWVGRAGYRPELWAIGLRNPWRYSFDRETGELWIGDVGQNAWEEIDVEDPKAGGGRNYGWRTMEGNHCFSPRQLCLGAGLEPPVWEYGHDRGCSVTGGYVYRGRALPGLAGRYLFGDYCSGTIWALERTPDGEVRVEALLRDGAVSSFGEDEAGELYVCDHAAGVVSRLERATGG